MPIAQIAAAIPSVFVILILLLLFILTVGVLTGKPLKVEITLKNNTKQIYKQEFDTPAPIPKTEDEIKYEKQEDEAFNNVTQAMQMFQEVDYNEDRSRT